MISRIDIDAMTDAQDEAPMWPKRLDTAMIRTMHQPFLMERTSDDPLYHATHWIMLLCDEIDRLRADLTRPSQAGDERVARALGVVAAMLQGEAERQAGVPFSGTWSIPDYNWRGTVDDALDMADAALAAMDTPKGGGE